MKYQDLVRLMKGEPSRIYVQDLFFVISNEDTNEGRGAPKCIGAFEFYSQAAEQARGEGVFGGDADIQRRSALVVDVQNARYVLESTNILPIRSMSEGERETYRKEVAKRALSKLSDEERESLGLRKDL